MHPSVRSVAIRSQGHRRALFRHQSASLSADSKILFAALLRRQLYPYTSQSLSGSLPTSPGKAGGSDERLNHLPVTWRQRWAGISRLSYARNYFPALTTPFCVSRELPRHLLPGPGGPFPSLHLRPSPLPGRPAHANSRNGL
jgi:hypothetical protein